MLCALLVAIQYQNIYETTITLIKKQKIIWKYNFDVIFSWDVKSTFKSCKFSILMPREVQFSKL